MTAGITTILVTHRLSSVRHAERIVVLDPERGIVEDGSYDELMAADGQFASLFRLQAGRFR
jgi:ATP-binding cassette subfamily B protein